MLAFLGRLLRTGWTSRRDREVGNEMEFHLEQLAGEYQRGGMDARAAGQAALKAFGGAAHARQAWRDQRALPAAEELLQDVQYGWRVLWRSRGLTILAGVTLAFAVAATTSVFAVVDAVLLAPLPYGHAEQLCVIYEHYLPQDAAQVSVTSGTFLEWQDRARAFSAFTAIDRRQANLTSDGEPQQVVLGAVSQGFARTVEVQRRSAGSLVRTNSRPGTKTSCFSDMASGPPDMAAASPSWADQSHSTITTTSWWV